MDKLRRRERRVYLIILTFIFLLPVFGELFESVSADAVTGFSFRQIAHVWVQLLPFLALFLVHDLFLVNLLLRKQKRGLYAILTGLLMACFAFYVYVRPRPNKPYFGIRKEMVAPPPSPSAPPSVVLPSDGAAPSEGALPPRAPSGRSAVAPPAAGRPLKPEILYFLLGLSVIGFNVGLKFYFRALADEQQMEDLERENLKQQMAYLRYQINPHFFMNTLNTLHALVDIAPEQAKESIVELSKMMRYLLYEGSKPTIPLDHEAAFLSEYISLMRMRYDDKVRIDVDLPSSVPGVEVPPLVFVSFVENAFKHGVSYESDSFIRVNLKHEDGKVTFRCVNSRHGVQDTGGEGGIGMENVRRKLSLLYGEDYSLRVEQDAAAYDLQVVIPALPSEERGKVKDSEI